MGYGSASDGSIFFPMSWCMIPPLYFGTLALLFVDVREDENGFACYFALVEFYYEICMDEWAGMENGMGRDDLFVMLELGIGTRVKRAYINTPEHLLAFTGLYTSINCQNCKW